MTTRQCISMRMKATSWRNNFENSIALPSEFERNESFSKRLRRLRIAKQISVAKVSSALEISESTYREWELGRHIRGEPYVPLAELLGVSLNELMTGQRTLNAELLKGLQEIGNIVERLKCQL